MRFARACAVMAVVGSSLFFSFANGADPGAAASVRRQEFVEIAPGRSLYVDYILPKPGRPTIVLFNGLTYRTGPGCWEEYANELARMGFGVFMWDPRAMGQTLLREGAPEKAIDWRDQVAEAELLFRKVGLPEKLHLVGLSYGGALAITYAVQHPERVATLELQATYEGPLANQDLWIKMQIAATRALYPFNQASDDDLYGFFLRNLVYTTYPLAEPIVLENPYKLEATFRLAQGVRAFLGKDWVKRLPAGTTHMIIGRDDRYIANSLHDALWAEIPAAARMSRIYYERTGHKIPEEQPRFAASVTRMIVEKNPALSGGKTFVGSPTRSALQELDETGRTAEVSTRAPRPNPLQCGGFLAAAR